MNPPARTALPESVKNNPGVNPGLFLIYWRFRDLWGVELKVLWPNILVPVAAVCRCAVTTWRWLLATEGFAG